MKILHVFTDFVMFAKLFLKMTISTVFTQWVRILTSFTEMCCKNLFISGADFTKYLISIFVPAETFRKR